MASDKTDRTLVSRKTIVGVGSNGPTYNSAQLSTPKYVPSHPE